MTYREFFGLLEAHDWYFNFTDDSGVYDIGKANLNKLQAIAKDSTSSLPQEMFDAYEAYIFSGEAFGKVQLAKPRLVNFKKHFYSE